MKIYKYFIIISIMAISACASNQPANPPQYFATPEEAVKKATSDLAEVVRTGKDFNLGINLQDLENAMPGSVINNYDIDFNLLMKADTSISFSKMIASEKNKLFPLISKNKIITVVELRKEEKGWTIAGFSSQSLSNDLTAIMNMNDSIRKSEIIIYDIPNLSTNVYEVKLDRQQFYLTNYKRMFSVKKPAKSQPIIAVMKEDALRFQKEYGDSLKRQMLVD